MLRVVDGSRLWLQRLPVQQQLQPLIAAARYCVTGRTQHSTSMCSNRPPVPNGQASAAAVPSHHQPYRLSDEAAACDWVQHVELDAARRMADEDAGEPLKVLVLYGSLRQRSYSKLLAYEFSRILERLGAEVRVFNPEGLPMKDELSTSHPKVEEIRSLSMWSEAQVWVSPEQHGAISGVFKNQIDWIPLSLGSVRPTQGRVLAIAQVNGGSQSFNAVCVMRNLGRWMRMFTIPNQSSVPKAWTEFDDDNRMKPGSLRDRVVDVAEELLRFGLLLRPHSASLVDRYSEREEKRRNGRLLSQAEKEAAKAKDVAAKG